MCDRYPGYLFGGTPVSSWDRPFNMENQIQHQYRGRSGPPRFWGSMSEGGGVSNAGGDSCKTNLIVNYLPQSMTEKDLYGMFMNIGPIESCRVMKDFKGPLRAAGHEGLQGEWNKDKTNLIVNYLPQSMTEKDLYGMFMNIGPIESCRVMKDFKYSVVVQQSSKLFHNHFYHTDWDAQSSEPQGLLFANRYQLGNFDQCMNAPWASTHTELATKYCLADIVLERTDRTLRKKVQNPFNPYQSALDYIE
ncbi:Sex-lethal isoform 2, partial [Operophtera brumata]